MHFNLLDIDYNRHIGIRMIHLKYQKNELFEDGVHKKRDLTCQKTFSIGHFHRI